MRIKKIGELFVETGDLDDRVTRAAAELGVLVPRGFHFLGIDEDGEPIALTYGDPNDFEAAAAILARLGGAPVADCFAGPERTEREPKPAWWPPENWDDTEALLAYVRESGKHPEWPQFYNGTPEWLQLATASGVPIAILARAWFRWLSHRDDLRFQRDVVNQAAQQGVQIDPAAVIRASLGTPQAGDGAGSQNVSPVGTEPPQPPAPYSP